MWSWARGLRDAGVIGINRRNCEYLLRYNDRARYPLVDDKLRTKELALEAGLAVPALYGIIRAQAEIRSWVDCVEGTPQFVIKPAHGSGGDGILVVVENRKGRYRLAGGQLIRRDEIDHQISGIVSGQYSLGGVPDYALIEYCVQADPIFQAISYQGVPDIRIIVFHGYPVMAMVRLPTRQSKGKANLHQGAIGVGIDLISGQTLDGVIGNDLTTEHPDTGQLLRGIQVPKWRNILELAARGYDLAGLGYLGVDIVLDRTRGPLVLELNARPGLNIQIANRCGLRPRLQLIEELADPSANAAERVERVLRRFEANV